MANILLGMVKGFTDAGNKSMEENDRFNRELEKATRLQAMQAYSEKQKIFDDMKTLKPGVEVAAATAQRAGISWRDLSVEDQQAYTQYALDNHDEIISLFEPGEAPTYENYGHALKRDKVVDWIRDKAGVTPRYAYSRQSAISKTKEKKKLPPMELSEPKEVNPIDLVFGKVNDIESALTWYYTHGKTPPPGLEEKYRQQVAKEPKSSWVNMINPETGDKKTVDVYSPDVAVLAKQGYITAGKFELGRPIDYKNLIGPALSRVDEWVFSIKDMEIPKGSEHKKELEHLKSVAETLFEYREDNDEQGLYTAFAHDLILRYEKLGNVDDPDERWQTALEEALENVTPDSRTKIVGMRIPFTGESGGIIHKRSQRGRRRGPPPGDKESVTNKQRLLNSIPQSLHTQIGTGIYRVKASKTNWQVVDSEGNIISEGEIK